MEWVRFLHVLLGAIWIGGAMYGEALVAGSKKKGREAYATSSVSVQMNSARIYPIVVPLVAVTAAILIWQSDHIGWGDLWISLSFAIWLVGLLIGILFFAKRAKAAAGMLEADGVTDGLMKQIAGTEKVQRGDLLFLAAILALMIFQPV